MTFQRLSIAHLAASFLPIMGGMEVVVHALAQSQTDLGHDVTVFCPARAWWAMRRQVNYRLLPLPPRFGAMDLDAFRAGQRPPLRHARFFSLMQRLMGFDVWHVHMLMPTAFAATPGLERSRARWLVTAHGADIQAEATIGYGYRLISGVEDAIADTLRRAPLVTAVSQSVRNDFTALGADPNRIRDVPNGLWLDRFCSLDVDRAAVRARLGIAEGELLILTVGRNHPKKGFDLLPDALARLAGRCDGWRMVLVGRGNDVIAARMQALGLGERVRFMTEIGPARTGGAPMVPSDDLIALYRAADIFLLPTRIESFGMVTAEAMAAGLAVVTTDAPGSRDIIRHGVDGLLAPINDAAALGDALIRLVEDPGLRQNLGNAAAEAAAAFDWPKVAATYLDCYRELLRADT